MRGQRYGVQVSRGSYAGPSDVHLAPRGFALGQGAAAVSVPDAAIATAWAAGGWARTLLRWVVGLSDRLVGVVVHPAGDLVLDIATFAQRAEGFDDPDSRAFTAFFDLGADRETMTASSYGMAAFGLPEVHATLSSMDDDVEFDRAHEAILRVCHQMHRDARRPADGQLLRVPVGLEVGNAPLELDNPEMDSGAAMSWTVRSQPDAIALTRNGKPLDTDALWQAAAAGGAAMGYSAYRRMLLRSLERSFEITQVAQADFHQQRAPVPPNEVRVYRQRDGRCLLITCGYGRLRQPGGVESKGSAFLELALELSDHHPDIAKALSTLGRLLHARPTGETPIVPGDRLRLPMYGLDRFLFLPLIKVTPRRGPSIQLVSPLPLTEDEYRRVSQRGTFDPNEFDQAVRDRWLTVVGKPR
jgi:hypothetical protein